MVSKIKVLEPRRVVRHVARVMVGDLEVTYELLDLLEQLQDVGDGLFSAILINDRREGETLERLGLAARSSKNSYHAGPKLEEWLKAAHNAGVGTKLAESAKMAYGV